MQIQSDKNLEGEGFVLKYLKDHFNFYLISIQLNNNGVIQYVIDIPSD
jgi:hypothetical protein